jgi:nucleotide-binding universal stress UspA family protein
VATASREAVHRDADLVVLTVPSRGDLRAERLADVAPREHSATASADAVAARGLTLAREAEPGVRARSLVCGLESATLRAELASADLLVLGTHGQGGQRVLSLGSTSATLAHLAGSPVHLVAAEVPPEVAGRTASVVVGFDEQPGSRAALAYGLEQAAMTGAALSVVRAVLPGLPGEGASVADAERSCHAALSELAPTGLEARVVVEPAPTLDALLSACAPSTLLVVGNRGEGHLRGPVIGSLTSKLVASASCDVVLVPTPADSSRAAVESALGAPAASGG